MSIVQSVQKSIPRIPARRRLVLGLVFQGLISVASLYVALLLRLDLDQSRISFSAFWSWIPVLIALRLGSLIWFKAHTGLWRYVSVPDLISVAKATTASSLIFVIAAAVATDFEGLPRSVFLIEWGVHIFFAGGVRMAVRVARERIKDSGKELPPKRRVIVVGAGDAGAAFCAQAKSTPDFRIDVVAVVDDDLSKIGSSLIGTPVTGSIDDLPTIVERNNADLIVIATPSATVDERSRIIDKCRESKVEFRILPGTNELLEGNVSISKLRRVDVADLLGRPETKLDEEVLANTFTDKVVVVTGSAGTIGSELARRVLEFSPARLVLIDRAENPLVLLDYELRAFVSKIGNSSTEILARIADITDRDSIRNVLKSTGVDVVLHAAAHKHVNLMENTPADAVLNNMCGVVNVGQVAADLGAEKFVLVSTDKAVAPTSVMGATKRMAELAIRELAVRNSTQYTAVRFGNVLGSNASVVPIFQQQIEAGGPVTVTHPEAERYFMTAFEAAGLILMAAAIGENREIYLLDMGTPVKIDSLARTMIELSGMVPDQDINIEYTGLKPGEKLTEVLASRFENLSQTSHEKLLLVDNSGSSTDLDGMLEFANVVRTKNPAEVKEGIASFVHDYSAATD